MGDQTVQIIDETNSLASKAIRHYLEKNEWEITSSKKADNLILINTTSLPVKSSDYEKVIHITDAPTEKSPSTNTLTLIAETNHTLSHNTDEYLLYSYEIGYFYPLNKTILQYLNGDLDHLIDSVIDFSKIKEDDENCIIAFENINESYQFLNRKNGELKKQRFVEVLKAHINDDSENEIKYLTNRLKQARAGVDMIEIVIGTKEEFKILEKNYFYNEFKRNIGEKYNLFYIDKDYLKGKNKELYKKVCSGFCLYEDCVYFDYESNPNSLGFVDLSQSKILEYREVFEELKAISQKIKK